MNLQGERDVPIIFTPRILQFIHSYETYDRF